MQIVADPSISGSSILAETPYAAAPSHPDTPNGPSPSSSHVSDSPRLAEQSFSTANGSPGNGGLGMDNKDGSVEAVSPTLESVVQTPGLSQSFPGAAGYLANRWNTSTFSTPSSMARDGSIK